MRQLRGTLGHQTYIHTFHRYMNAHMYLYHCIGLQLNNAPR